MHRQDQAQRHRGPIHRPSQRPSHRVDNQERSHQQVPPPPPKNPPTKPPADRALNPLDIHHNPHHPFTLTTPLTTIFGPSPSCLLAPDTTVGPFYLTGELIRSSLVESQPGVPLHLDLLVIDTSTCLPLVDPTVYIELWSANATGVYGGYSGPSNAPGDSDNVRSSWLRGAQPLDAETGTAQFDTIFPGHYPGRAPHVHVMVHRRGAVVGGNGTTIRDAVATHTGQLFFDQELVEEVVGTWPYVENGSGELVRNEADYYVPLAERDGNDPFVSYVYLNGRNVGGGLLGWMSVGVDMSRQMNVRVAGTFRGGE